jgi:hypothetical protein
MTTSRNLKQLLRPLLARRADIAFVGRTLFLQPLTHYLRGVEFKASRFHTASQAISFPHQLYNGQGVPDFGSSDGYKYQMAKGWEQDLEQTSITLCNAMEREALPAVEGIVDYINHQKSSRYFNLPPGSEISDSPRCTFLVALGECSVGDLDSAEQKMSPMMARLEEYPFAAATEEFRYHPLLFWRMAYLTRLLQTDRGRVLPLLHDWEAHAVKGMKLTKYWKPMPFPCEL